MTREDFIVNCNTAYDMGLCTPRLVHLLSSWIEFKMRIDASQTKPPQPKPRCRHCHRGRVTRPAGLCWWCWHKVSQTGQRMLAMVDGRKTSEAKP